MPAEWHCTGSRFGGLMGHQADGIAAVQPAAAAANSDMKISDVPQSGKLGTFITFRNRFGEFRRPYVVPKDPRTPAQVRVRSGLGRASARWRVLTDRQRAAWAAAAGTNRSRARLGKSGPLTGCQLYVKINTNLALVGEPPVDDPPDYPRFGANPVGALAITNDDGAIALKLNVPSAPARFTLIWATAPCSAGLTFPPRFVCLGLLPAPVDGISDITALYLARYGAPPPGKRVFIQSSQQINGWQDGRKRTTAVVPNP
jgi:hypothetical protein